MLSSPVYDCGTFPGAIVTTAFEEARAEDDFASSFAPDVLYQIPLAPLK